MADIAADDAAAKMSGSAYLQFLLHGGARAADAVRAADRWPGRPAEQSLFQIQFAAPSPLGLLGPQGP